MRKSLLAFSVLGCFATMSMADPSVTVYGLLDQIARAYSLVYGRVKRADVLANAAVRLEGIKSPIQLAFLIV